MPARRLTEGINDHHQRQQRKTNRVHRNALLTRARRHRQRNTAGNDRDDARPGQWTGQDRDFFRELAASDEGSHAKLGTAQAITATAHKIARVLYHVLLTKQPYTETVFHRSDEHARRRAEMRLRKHAALLGFQIIPVPADSAT
jgi:hypothetical protein